MHVESKGSKCKQTWDMMKVNDTTKMSCDATFAKLQSAGVHHSHWSFFFFLNSIPLHFLEEYRRGERGGSKQSDRVGKETQRSYFACVFFVSELLCRNGFTFLLSFGMRVFVCLFIQSTIKYEK